MDRRALVMGAVPVVHVITQLELGGAQQNTLHTVARLDRARFRPHLLCGPGGLLDDEARALNGVELHFVDELERPIRPGRDLTAARVIADLLRDVAAGGPCVVHTHSSKAGIVGRWAAHRAGVGPVVHTIHGFGHDAVPGRFVRRAVLAVERTMARHTDAFVSVSRANEVEGLALRLLGGKPCRIIRSGIDVDDFARADALRAAARAELGYAPDARVVGMIACLKPQKAPADFVDLAARVLEQAPDVEFFLAGDGELRADVERLVEANGIGPRFRLLGWRRDVPELLGALDVLVLTSRWEGLPRVCPQAMAAGRPVVATNVDGIPEAVVEGRNGFLFEPGDTALAARRVLTLLDDPSLRRRHADAGRRAVDEFRQETMVAEQERLYDELLAARAGALRPRADA
ncbi:MAG: glycosyltransferase family 4 protein [Planctomycetes bacterium]|nr:glycosyltransferase family 4 protein [Planctomycetota bacterium]